MTTQMAGLKLSEGFKETRSGRKESARSRSRSASVRGSASGSPARSRQSSRGRSMSVAGSPERTPSPSPSRDIEAGKKRNIVDLLDIGEVEPTGHLTVKLSNNKAATFGRILKFKSETNPLPLPIQNYFQVAILLWLRQSILNSSKTASLSIMRSHRIRFSAYALIFL